jgi:hypothetical protein
MVDLARWIAQSSMSDPGGYASQLARLPDDAALLSRVVQGVLIHLDWLSAYGLDDETKAFSRETLGAAAPLTDIFERDPQPLDVQRPAGQRSPATCRDFALMLTSLFRVKKIPARLRCGFAAYLSETWEDHWVCEYLAAPTGHWRLADAQIDEVLKRRLGIRFVPWDAPRDLFLTAGEAWLACRAGKHDPRRFGHGATKGWRFIQVNVMRDHYALNGAETSPWDQWRAATGAQPDPTEAESVLIDAIAATPDQSLIEIAPYWLT